MTKISFIIVFIVIQFAIKLKRCSLAQFSIYLFEATMLGLIFSEVRSLMIFTFFVHTI